MSTALANELPETMQAVVAYAPRDYRFETVPVPRAGPDDIIIQVECCGICAGELESLRRRAVLLGRCGATRLHQGADDPGP